MQADSDCFNSESICIMRLANMGGISQKTLYIFYCTQDYFNDVFIYEQLCLCLPVIVLLDLIIPFAICI